ncbi:unnamed protein product [Caenorhabditis auriculariae]|uniref:Uncharacterized protein n=1 Tax=Caenorhabditis auriculariae TaxID=2777116 RepID=A0A8S1H695_9PELO|nr:unnamed protein product [Caenorhabditis auriculariae]
MLRRQIGTLLKLVLLLFVAPRNLRAQRRDSLEDIPSYIEEPTPIPKGIFHYSDTAQNIQSKFRVPDFEALDPIRVAADLMSSAVKADTDRHTLAGFQIPISLTGRPLNLQLDGQSRAGVSLAESMRGDQKPKKNSAEVRKTEPRSEMTPEARNAFHKAREVCIRQTESSCDEALDTFHRVRYGKSLLVDEETQGFTQIIEDRLREMDKTSTDAAPSSSSEQEEEEEEKEEDDFPDEEREEHPFSNIRLLSSRKSPPRRTIPLRPTVHDKARQFLRRIT